MGKILIIRDADFSNSPGAVKVSSIPVVGGNDLLAFYSSGGATVDTSGGVESIGSDLLESTPRLRSAAPTKSTVVASSFLKGSVISFDASLVSSYSGYIPMSVVDGVSFSILFRRNTPSISTGGNAVIFGCREIGLQLRVRAATGQPHLLLQKDGVTQNFTLNYDTPIGQDRITLTLDKLQVKFYLNGALMNTYDISTFNLIDTFQNIFVGSNWNLSTPSNGVQLSQFYVHGKALSLSEVQSLHSGMFDLIKS